MSDRRERRLRMHLASGRFTDLDAPPPPADDEDRWLGEIDPLTGRSTVDLEKARRWRPLRSSGAGDQAAEQARNN